MNHLFWVGFDDWEMHVPDTAVAPRPRDGSAGSCLALTTDAVDLAVE